MLGEFDEDLRLEALAAYEIGPREQDGTLDDLTAFGAALCEAPICVISLVEAHRQRFIARAGLAAAETPRETSFCQHAMRGDALMVVPDARLDGRFKDNALVTGPPFIRFYAGAPLRSPEGAPLGALCVIDSAPREGLTPLQAQGLTVMAGQVMALLNLRREDARRAGDRDEVERLLSDRESRFRVLADTMPQMVWSTRADGFHDYYNARWYAFTGTPPGSTDGEAWNDMFHPDDQERAWAAWRHSLATGDPYEIEYRLRHVSGDYRWTLGRALPMRDADGAISRWFGTCTDIDDQKRLLEERQMVSQELSHRIKNIFAIIAGMISLAMRRHPEARFMAEDLRGRVIALGRAHDFVRPHSAESMPKVDEGSLHGMLRKIFQPYAVEGQERVRITGDNPRIDDRAATPLALLFHELSTNAAKYGALTRSEGVIDLSVSQTESGFRFDWRESGGPPVAPPEKTGFGTQLVEMTALRQLGGSLTRAWRPEGLHLTMDAPRNSLMRGG